MFLKIMSKTLSTGLGRVAAPLVAALLLVGCGGGGGGGGVFTGGVSQAARVIASVGSGGGVVQSNTSIGNSAPQTSTAFSSQPEQDASNANNRLARAALGSLSPSFQAANTNRLTSQDQGAILLSTGTVTAAVQEGVVERDVPVNQGTDQGQAAGFAFVGGGSKTSSIGQSQAIAAGRQSPGTAASSRVAVSYGKPFVGELVSNVEYAYSGALVWTRQDSFTRLVLGQVTVTVNVGVASQSFRISGGSTDNAGTASFNEAGSIALNQSSGFTFDARTGRFTIASADIGAASNTNGFRPGAIGGAGTLGAPVPIMLMGQFTGADGQAISGVFTTVGETENEYVGVIIGDGPATIDETTLVRFSDGGAILDRSLNFLGASAATLSHFVTADFSQLYAHINSPLADIATQGLFAGIRGLGSGDGATFAAGTTEQIVAAGDLRRVTTSASYRARNVVVTSYGDPDGVARLLVVDGTSRDAVGAFLVSGGLAIQTPGGGASISGTHTYHGAQLVGLRDSVQNAQPVAIGIEVNFGTRTFTYSTLNSAAQAVSVAGTATLTTAQLAAGTVTSDAFTVTPRGQSGITAEFRGRAGGLWQAISGVFATNTDSGPQYAGGFVAYLHDRATDVSDAAGNTVGIGRIDGIILESGDGGVVDHALFVASDVEALINAENDLPSRGTGLLSSIRPDLSGVTAAAPGAVGHALKFTRNFDFDSQSVSADIYFDLGRAARLLVLHGADNNPVVSAIVAGGSDFSGTLSGAYTYTGAYLYAAKATAHEAAIGSFSLVASFAGGSVNAFRLAAATPAGADASSLVFTPAGTSATISGARFSATGGFFKRGSGTAGSDDQPVILHGIFSGAGAQAISGVFATQGTSGTQYVGGFVGGGRSDVATRLGPVSGRASGLGALAQRNLGSGTNGIAVAGDDYAALIAGTAAASDTARDNAFLAGLSPSGFAAAQAVVFADGITTHLEGRANTRTGGAHNSGGGFPATEWTNQGGQARLVLFDGSGVTGTGARGSFLAAGGAAPPANGVLTGGFTWSGALVLGRADALHATPEIGRFTLRYDFAGSDTVKGSLEGAFADIPGNGDTTTPATIDVDVAIGAASGTIANNSDGTFELVAGATFDGVLAGFASGASAQGISGVFATNGTSSTQYVGGFVGGAPVLAQVLADPANGLRIGAARDGVAGTPAAGRGSLFLGVDAAAFNTHANALNTVSDAARGNALLSNLHAPLADGALLPDTGITKYTLSPDNKITYGTSEAASGVVFGNSDIGLRLVALDVFIAVGGTLLTTAISGRFEYTGAFVSAAPASDNVESAFREGTFDLVADLAGASDTHYFTLDAQTVNAGGAVTTQLDVTQANGGTINATTGAFSATAASFIEGAGSAGGIQALVHGRLLNGGDGVAGLFTTTQAGTLYAGGFVGAVRNVVQAYGTTPTYAGDGNSAFVTSSRLAIGGEQVGQTFLFATNAAAALIDAANDPTASIRDHAFLTRAGASSVASGTIAAVTTGTFSAADNGISSATAGGATYDSDGDGTTNSPVAIPITVYADTFRLARFAHARHTTSHTTGTYGSFVIAGGARLTGTLTGAYEWLGRIGYADASAFGADLTFVNTTITATNLGVDAPVLTFALPTASSPGLTGTLSLDKDTGVLTNGTTVAGGTTSSALSFQTDGVAANKVAAVFAGRLHGSRGIALAGVFATADAQVGGTTDYAGALVAAGAVNLSHIAGAAFSAPPTTALTLARGQYVVNGHAAAATSVAGAYFLVPQGSNAIAEASHASTAIRNASVVASVASIAGTSTAHRVATRVAGDGAFTIGRHASGDLVVYQDRPGASPNASLVFAGGSTNAARLIAASGAATAGIAGTGNFTWEGAQFLGSGADLSASALTAGRFTLTADFSASTFSYTGGTTDAAQGTLTASGSVATTGVLTSTSFRIAGLAAGDVTQGSLYGRLAGAGGTAVSGVFISTNAGATAYAGGFVGGVPQIVYSTHAFTGTGEEGGFGEAFVTLNTEATNSRLVFVSNDLGALEAEANVASDAARAASLLDAIVTTGGSPTTTTTLGVTRSEGGSYTYKSGTAGLDRYVAGANDVTLLVVDGSAQSGESVIAHRSKPHTGAISNGAYTWQGVQFSAARAELHDTTSGTFQITATFSDAATTGFTYTTIGASQPFTLSGSGTITKSTGRLASTALSFDADGADTTSSAQTTRLQGAFGGANGESLVGLFATTSGATGYAGGFVGTGKQDVHTIRDETTDFVGLGFVADRSIGTGTANGLALVGDDYDALLATTRGAGDATRDASIVANIAPTGLGAAGPVALGADQPQVFANERTGGSISYGDGGTSYTVTAWEDGSGVADLLFLNGTGVSNSGSFFIAGGDSRPASSVLTGEYTWEGVLVYTGRSLHTNQQKSRFRLTYVGNLTYALFVPFDGSRFGIYATISSDTGRISTTDDRRLRDDFEISGFVSGNAAEAVSGVFTGRDSAGGFVGGAPVLARVLADPANGLRIGTAREDLSGTSGHGRGSLFLSSSTTTFDTHLKALNQASHTLRGNALLANLRDALNGGAPVPNTGISKYTLSSSNKITYGSDEAATGVVFGDSALGLRLVAVDGFIAAGGTLLTAAIGGTFRYSGAFVSAASGSLGSALREGTFDLVADLSGAGSTHYFTLNAQTVNAGGTVTSQLDVTQANGGTINATTGAFSAAAASFIEGAGTAGGIPALVHGRILSGGGGVAGLFTTTQAGTIYAGGFVGAGPQVASDVYSGSETTGNSVGQANRSVFSGTAHDAGRILFLGENYTARRDGLNVASDTVRDQHILSSLGVAATGGTAVGSLTKHTGVSVTHGSAGATAQATALAGRQPDGTAVCVRRPVCRRRQGSVRRTYRDVRV